MKLDNIKGKKYGRLTVMDYAGKSKWICKCECGTYKEIQSAHLKDGHTKSCGCLQKEIIKKNAGSHYQTKTKLYKKYRSIIDRTEYPSNKSYNDYGARGIKMCSEWRNNFVNFYNWALKNGYSDELTIDRIDVNGDYEPNNCRWVDIYTQANNKRNNVYYEYKNEKHTLREWARIKNIPFSTLRHRIERGWDMEQALK